MTARTPRLALAALAVVLAWAPAARAHHGGQPAADAGGLDIPGLTHGQMAAVAPNAAAILDLAARQPGSDPTTRRLQEFISFQSFACLWSLVPGSLSDEDSPFNECTHASLAATLALYRHVRPRAADTPAALALDAALQRDMLQRSSALVLCRFSDETFNTGELVLPRLRDIAVSPAAAASLLALLGASAAAAWLLLALSRPAARDPEPSS